MSRLTNQAIVIGAGLAGICAARVLCEHGFEVTVLEKDPSSAHPAFRPGLPQSRHSHLLLAGGYRRLRRWFPRLIPLLQNQGAQVIDCARDILVYQKGGWAPRYLSGVETVVASRELLDWSLRRCLTELPRITIRTGEKVTAIRLDTRRNRITGVIWGRTELSCEIVVDASGYGSHMPRWLSEYGRGRPEESVVDAWFGQASRFYRRPRHFLPDWPVLTIGNAFPVQARSGAVNWLESDVIHVTLNGGRKDYPPVDEDGFLAFARGLRVPAISEIIESAEPLSPIFIYRNSKNRFRHWEKMGDLPAGLFCVGDAMVRFNSMFTWGMTESTAAAEILGRYLHDNRVFHAQLARHLLPQWRRATLIDSIWNGSNEHNTKGWKHRYRRILHYSAMEQKSPAVHRLFLRESHLLDPSGSLLKPRRVVKVLAIAAGLRARHLIKGRSASRIHQLRRHRISEQAATRGEP